MTSASGKKRRILLMSLLMAAVLLIGCQARSHPTKANYDTDISPESMKSAGLLIEEYQVALDDRLEAYNRSFHESLERGLTLQILQLSLEENMITLRPVGLSLSLCVDIDGETAQCVFAGALKGDIQRGYGGDWKRYGWEIRWAEAAGLTPLAYVDLGTSSFVPVLLVQEEQELRVLWYANLAALHYSGEGDEVDYRSGVTEDTSWSLESLELLMEGYERYLEMCRLYPNNYLGLQWLSLEEYQGGVRK